jgi:hypothetical protein
VLIYFAATILLPICGILFTVNYPTAYPDDRQVCTMSCHEKGCKHQASFPGWISGDDGLYGKTIDGLFSLGEQMSSQIGTSRFESYGLVNLLVFCLLTPLAHLFVMAVTLFCWRGSRRI